MTSRRKFALCVLDVSSVSVMVQTSFRPKLRSLNHASPCDFVLSNMLSQHVCALLWMYFCTPVRLSNYHDKVIALLMAAEVNVCEKKQVRARPDLARQTLALMTQCPT